MKILYGNKLHNECFSLALMTENSHNKFNKSHDKCFFSEFSVFQ